MSISIEATEKLVKVAILGQLEQAGECEQLLKILSPTTSQIALELDFYDAQWLPAGVLEAIAIRLNAGLTVKTVVYRHLLARVLAHFNLPYRKVSGYVPLSPLPECKALVLAGSAQSLDKILHIIGCLPDAEIAVFIVQHIGEDQINLLDKLLKVVTSYQVLMPQNLQAVKTGTIYIAPPKHHLRVAHGLVYLTCDRKIQFARPSIDVLFESVAGEYGQHAIGVLLCGFGQDGVQGCAALKNAGAFVILENGTECQEAQVLPNTARQSGYYDHILSCAAIASIVAAAVSGENAAPSDSLQKVFLAAIKADYGYDLLGYQHHSLERRIKEMMMSLSVSRFCDFQRLLLSKPKLFQRFLAEIPVIVTEFFRHPEQFLLLRQEVLPYLASFPLLKIWSAGCATGEEAYSVAIVLEELGLLQNSRIFATDINPYALELAKRQLFPQREMEKNCKNYLSSGGIASFESYVTCYPQFFKMDAALGERIFFHGHSLAQDGVFNEFELIMCRNVLIYFDVQTQEKILQCFAKSLHIDGFLVLGPQDGLQNVAQAAGFVLAGKHRHIYKLQAGGSCG